MENKKLVKIAVGIAICIVFLIIVEVGIKSINMTVTERIEENKKEEIKKEYEETPEYKEQLYIEGVVKECMELLNSKNLDEIYSKINVEYKDYKFNNDKTLFENYIQKYLKDEATLELQKYERYKDKYICDIASYSNDESVTFLILITKNELDDTYDLIFDEIYGLEKIDLISQDKNNIKANLIYEVMYAEAISYVIEYENVSQKDKTYILDAGKMYNTRGLEYISEIERESISLKAGEKVRVEYIFSGEGINVFTKTNMTLGIKEVLGEEMYFEFDLDY